MNISDLLNNKDQDIRRDTRIGVQTFNFGLLEQSVLQTMRNFPLTGQISLEEISKIGDLLSKLTEPEQFGLNLFLLKLLVSSQDPQIQQACCCVLSNNFSLSNENLPSYNPNLFANDESFLVLLNILASAEPKLSRLARDIISSVFETINSRDFISFHVYEHIFEHILTKLDDISIFMSVVLNFQELSPELLDLSLKMILSFLNDKIDKIASVGTFGLFAILRKGIKVNPEIIELAVKRFLYSYDETITQNLILIMRYLEEPPHFFFKRLLLCLDNYDNMIYSICLKLISQFLNEWTDEEKQAIVHHLWDDLPKIEQFNSYQLAFAILLKYLNPLPTDCAFFNNVTLFIESSDDKILGIIAIQNILQSWLTTGIDPEKIKLITELQGVLENLQNNEFQEEICGKVMENLQNNQILEDICGKVLEYIALNFPDL